MRAITKVTSPADMTLGGEGQNFEQSNFRMANISNLKINGGSNVERPNLRVTTIANEN